MVNTYNLVTEQDDPVISLKIPVDILRDLALRSEESGRSIESELAIRLARSLERDLEMIEQDNAMACKAFDKIQSNPELAMQCLSKSKK